MSLNFSVVKAILSNDCCTLSTMDPYFIATISNVKTFRSNVRKNEGKYPKWNDGTKFDLNGEATIKFEFFHYYFRLRIEY